MRLRAPSSLVALCCLVVASAGARAQIAPECKGIERPADYDEAVQQGHLQNYFAASFLLTPMAPIVPYDKSRAGLGLELGFVPPLGCEERLVLDGTKTEDTNKLPVSPRPRLTLMLPDLGPISSYAGLTLFPPVPTPAGTILQTGGELGAGWRSGFGLLVGARAHLSFARVRAEIATPMAPGDEAYDDLFFASVLGADVGVAWRFELSLLELTVALTPYANAGVSDVTTLFIVGDDFAVVQNPDYAWWGATAAAGVQALVWDEHIELVVEGSTAFPLYTTVKAKVGVAF